MRAGNGAAKYPLRDADAVRISGRQHPRRRHLSRGAKESRAVGEPSTYRRTRYGNRENHGSPVRWQRTGRAEKPTGAQRRCTTRGSRTFLVVPKKRLNRGRQVDRTWEKIRERVRRSRRITGLECPTIPRRPWREGGMAEGNPQRTARSGCKAGTAWTRLSRGYGKRQ